VEFLQCRVENDGLWHSKQIAEFWKSTYEGKPLLNTGIISEWIAIKGEPFIVFQTASDKKKYIGDIGLEHQLPVIVDKSGILTHGSKTYFHIDTFSSVLFTAKAHYDFKKLVDSFYQEFSHENPTDFLLFKISMMMTLIDRVNLRIVAPRAFGKSFTFKILGQAGQKVSVVNPKSDASIRMRLVTKTLVLDEISATSAEQMKIIQEFLLTAGDGGNIYEAPVRGSSAWGTQDTYDISELSLAVLHNPPEYYTDKGQTPFEDTFTFAVLDRFLKLNFKGQLLIAKGGVRKIVFDEYGGNGHNGNGKVKTENNLKMWNETLEYYKKNWKKQLLETGRADWLNFVDLAYLSQRKRLNLSKLIAGLALYCNSKEEFFGLLMHLNEKLEGNDPAKLEMKNYISLPPNGKKIPKDKMPFEVDLKGNLVVKGTPEGLTEKLVLDAMKELSLDIPFGEIPFAKLMIALNGNISEVETLLDSLKMKGQVVTPRIGYWKVNT